MGCEKLRSLCILVMLFCVALSLNASASISDDVPSSWSTDPDDYVLFFDFEDDNSSVINHTGLSFTEPDIACKLVEGLEYLITTASAFVDYNMTIAVAYNISTASAYNQEALNAYAAIPVELDRYMGYKQGGGDGYEEMLNGGGKGFHANPHIAKDFMISYWYFNGTAGNSSHYFNISGTENTTFGGVRTTNASQFWQYRVVTNMGICFDWIAVFSGTIQPPAGTDLSAPVNSSWNVTSGNLAAGVNSSVWEDNGTGGNITVLTDLLSFTVSSDEDSNMSCELDFEGNYTELAARNVSNKAATTWTMQHSFLMPHAISVGGHCVYCSFIDESNNEPAGGSSSSGCLNLTYQNNPPVAVEIFTPGNNTNVSGLTVISWNFSDSDLYNYSIYAVGSGGLELNGSGVVSYWDCEGDVLDNVGSNNGVWIGTSGTYNNSKGGNGTGSYACFFDGVNDFVNITDADNLSFGNGVSDSPFSVSLWAYTSSSALFPMFSKSSGVNLREYAIFSQPSVYIFGVTLNDVVASNRIGKRASASTFHYNKWAHLVMTYSGSGTDDGIVLYVNGTRQSVLTNDSGGTYVAMHSTSADASIGLVDPGYNSASGIVDEVYVFDYNLSDAEVASLYDKGHYDFSIVSEVIGSTFEPVRSIAYNFSLLPEHDYELFVEGFDVAAQSDVISHNVSVVLPVHPSLSGLEPVNDSVFIVVVNTTVNSSVNITFNFTVDFESDCDLFIGGVINQSLADVNSSNSFEGVVFGEPVNSSWFVNCTPNVVGLYSTSDTLSFEVLGVFYGGSSVTLIDPANASVFSTWIVDFQYYIDRLANCSLFINGTMAVNDTNISGATQHTLNFSGDNLTYEWFVACNTSDGFFPRSPTWVYTIALGDVIYDLLSLENCPSTLAQAVILIFVFLVGVVFVIIGFNVPVFGVFGSLIMIVGSFYIAPCIAALGILSGLLGFIMLAYFGIRIGK